MDKLIQSPCRIQTEYNDRVYFKGTYQECKDWLWDNYHDNLGIVSETTGRFLSVVWNDHE